MAIGPDEATSMAVVLAGVAEPTRMGILAVLAAGAAPVGDLAARVGVPVVNMSHHLNVLHRAGILASVKRGRHVLYALDPALFTPAAGPESLGTIRVGPWTLTVGRAA